MDNELDDRLRRLEAALAGHRKVLDGQAARLEDIFGLLQSLVSLLIKPEPEPDRPPLADLLAALIALMKHTAANTKQILAAVRTSGDERGHG